ncbi:EAL domain-containing protein [Pseudomonas sp. gcc21]|uniref:bifunctional diguanylate cyclase/phosphodiesterase n=1 Tax=Pseudomonas sp. gcc21 TaxID=2726989 RepID=UPI0014523B3E|nr:bifunctional diguanylate cyclase/phosphodiesterase [Pseudomonas sp. gcc21]QJD58088.1 EAL domain-containing protein [Pseudomonas sp. gcc21]
MEFVSGAFVADTGQYQDDAFGILFHRMPTAGLLVCEQSNRILAANSAFDQLFGWESQALQGLPDERFPLWCDAAERRRWLARYAAGQFPLTLDTSLRCRDGKTLACRLSIERVSLASQPHRLYLLQPLVHSTINDGPLQSRAAEPILPDQDSLALALDASQMGIWELDIRNGVLNASARSAALHGCSPNAWKGPLNIFMAVALKEDQRAMRRAFVAICRGRRRRHRLTYRISQPDGRLRWLEATARLDRDAEDQPLRLTGTLLDITARRRSEQALVESQQKFSELFQVAPEPYLLIYTDSGVIIELNRAFIRTFGYCQQDLIGTPMSNTSLIGSSKESQAVISELQAGKTVHLDEIEVRHIDGTLHICELSSALFTINRQHCTLVSLKDITARKAAESALRASENKFSRAFRASPDSISITEKRSGRHLDVNEGFTRLTGFTPVEAIGRTSAELELWAEPGERDAILAELKRCGRIRQRELRLRDKYDQIRIVLISVETLDINGTDCLLTTARDITEQKYIEERVRHLAYHDALTDLPNRLLLSDRLVQNIALYNRHRLKGALLFFDLDRFKQINDTLGHAFGDAVLCEVTRRMLSVVRKEDTVARLGGDEFVVLISGLEENEQPFAEQISQSAMKLLNVLAEPMDIDGHSLQLSTSVGIALIPDHGDNPETLLKRADIALYRVKESGRNGIAFFEEAMQTQAAERLAMEKELAQALQAGQMRIRYQPQFDVSRQRIIGVEAFLFWDHPDRGWLAPDTFEDALEQSDTLIETGHWLLEQSCQLLSRLLDAGLVEPVQFRVSVNVSARQFHHPDFSRHLHHALEIHGVPPRCLKLGIPESAVMQDMSGTLARMTELHQQGVLLSINNLGAGYSSLNYLKRLPVDVLKINQSFVQDCAASPHDAAVVRAIIGIAHSLDLEVVIEGIETREQLAVFDQLPCDYFQGPLFCPAVDAARLTHMLNVFRIAQQSPAAD